MASSSLFASSSRYLIQNSFSRSAGVSTFFRCRGCFLSYRAFLGESNECTSASETSKDARLDWRERISSESRIHSSSQVRRRFSAFKYTACASELLRGLWSLDKNPIWLLVDQLIATGKPHNMEETCPDFLKWQHVVDAPDFFTAVATLLNEGYLPPFKLDTVDDIEAEDDIQINAMPPWLALYLACAKLDSPRAAHAGVSFAISQLEKIPETFRLPLLVLAMRAASEYRLRPFVPALLQAFRDMFTSDAPESIPALGTREAVTYQYNVFLMLLSRISLVPPHVTHIDLLIRHMHATGVLLDESTAALLIMSCQNVRFFVHTVQDIMEAQQATPSVPISISLARFFSKSRNQRMASKYIDGLSAIDSLAHAKTYILSFRDAIDSLAYLRTVEERHRDMSQNETDRTGEPRQRTSFASKLLSLQTHPRPTQKPSITPEQRLHIYTSLLFSAALTNNISAKTFLSMAVAVHAAHGGDKVLHTVVLIGFLRRRAWLEARDWWRTWEKLSIDLRRAVHETESFFERRERAFGDVEQVREELELTEHQSRILRTTAQRMAIDSTALASIVRVVAGTGRVGLHEAFEVMDSYAIKVKPDTPISQDVAPKYSLDGRFRPHDVRLTSRVINCFLMRAFAKRRPDIIFRFWDGVTAYYGVDVSIPTLELVLRAARIAASMEHSFVSFIPVWMLRGTPRDLLPPDAFRDLADEVRWMLSPKCRPVIRWNGLPAWRMARHVFREEILFANWPSLRDVTVPAHPVRGDAATGCLDALQELVAIGNKQPREIGPYPHLLPRARTFREYVLLLSRVHRSSEIPQVLAWMRALDVRPTRQMLSLFLGLWAEVGLGAPADDMWIERDDNGNGELRYGGEYGKLLAWLKDWLGEHEVPTDVETVASLKYAHTLEQKEKIQ